MIETENIPETINDNEAEQAYHKPEEDIPPTEVNPEAEEDIPPTEIAPEDIEDIIPGEEDCEGIVFPIDDESIEDDDDEQTLEEQILPILGEDYLSVEPTLITDEDATAFLSGAEEAPSEFSVQDVPPVPTPRERRSRPAVDVQEGSRRATRQQDSGVTPPRPRMTFRERQARNEKYDAELRNRERLLAVRSALEGKRIRGSAIEGRIGSVSERAWGADPNCVFADVIIPGLNHCTVHVPYSEMFATEIIDMRTVDLSTVAGRHSYVTRQKQILLKMLGATISVAILEIKEDSDNNHIIVIGSRSKAMESQRKVFFNPRNPLYTRGMCYEATIISVGPHAMALTFGGIDFRLRQRFVTSRFILDLQSRYSVGQKLPFILEDVKIKQNGTLRLLVNALAAELELAKERHYLVDPGTTCKATISSIHRNRRNPNYIDIYAWLDDYDIPVFIPFMPANTLGREPIGGDQCIVIISGYRSSGRLEARIRSISGGMGLFG